MKEMDTVRLIGKRAILFDVNQTLVRQGLSFESSFQSLWGDYAGRWLPEETPAGRQLWEQYTNRWQQRSKSRTTFWQLDELQQQCLQEAFQSLNIPFPASMTHSFLREVWQLQAASKTMAPGTIETLQALSHAYTLAIVSNSPRTEVIELVKKFALVSILPTEQVFTASRPLDKKPAIRLFRKAMDVLNVSPRQAVMVGNSWKNDVCGAVKAGMDAVWLHTQATTEVGTQKITQQRLGKRTVYIIQKLDQLQDLFL